MTTPISKGTKLRFRFIEQKEFDLLVSTETLTPGTWYFVDSSIPVPGWWIIIPQGRHHKLPILPKHRKQVDCFVHSS